jgi:integrase
MAYGEKRGKFWRVKYKGPKGKWLSASRDDYGNRFRTQKLAEDYGHALEAQARGKQRFIDPRDGTTTIGQFVDDGWADTWDLGETTERTYLSRLNAQILPEWKTTALSDYSAMGHKAWIKRLKTDYSTNYVQSVESVIRMLMDDAVVQGLIGENPIPVGRARRRGRHVPKKPAEAYVWPTPEHALAIAENARTVRGLMGYVMILTMAYTGMRIGEISGLLRSNVRLSTEPYGSSIQIDWQGQWVKTEGWKLLPPKYSSYRTLIIPPFLAGLLRELLDQPSKSDYVFTSITGRNMRVDDQFYGEFWHPVVDGRAAEPRRKGTKGRPELPAVAGVKGMVPHGTRHGHKVWLDDQGHPSVAVEARMGHELAGVEGVYSHVTAGMELRIAKGLQELWEASLKPGEVDLPKIAHLVSVA